MIGYYYLHTNGDIIYKKLCPDDNSPFVKKAWLIDTSDRADAWTVILESLALGANINRVKELCNKWNCTPQDFPEYIVRNPNPSQLKKEGAHEYLVRIVGVDPERYWGWLASTPRGDKPDYTNMPIGSSDE